MNRKTIIWIVVALFVVFVGFRIVSSKRKAKISGTDLSKPVYTQKVSIGSIQSVINISGNIVANQQADVFPRVPGKLISFLAQEGDYVREGQEIALIDRDEIGIAFSTAIVKSPINGMLLKKFDIDPGAKVSPMTPVATVGNIERVKAVVNLPESDFTRVRTGIKAQITVDSYPDRKFYGEVVTVAPQIDMVSRTGKVEIRIDNSDRKLRPGMFASVSIVTSMHSNIIVIPRDAVIEDGGAKKVFVIEDGKASEKNLSVGLFDDNRVEITGGLKAGDELITDGQRRLKSGDAVRIVKE